MVYEATSPPLMSVICHCSSCQKAAERIEEKDRAPAVSDAHGGTPLVVFDGRDTECVQGEELTEGMRLNDSTITQRIIATCCNSALMLDFDKGPYWVSAFHDRVEDAPAPEWRVQTKDAANPEKLPNDVPAYRAWPATFFFRLLRNWPRRKAP